MCLSERCLKHAARLLIAHATTATHKSSVLTVAPPPAACKGPASLALDLKLEIEETARGGPCKGTQVLITIDCVPVASADLPQLPVCIARRAICSVHSFLQAELRMLS